MYFPTSAARKLCPTPEIPQLGPNTIIALIPNPRRTLFCTLTFDGLTVWRVRPSVVLAHLTRTRSSIQSHGRNQRVSWSPDGSRLVIQTTASHLILVTVVFSLSSTPYKSQSTTSTNAQRHFLAGPGEGHPLAAVKLRFEGVIRIDGQIICISPRATHLLFATRTPPAVQRIPWPGSQDDEDHTKWLGHDTWLVNEDLPWLDNTDVTVEYVFYSRATASEAWVTSDGKVYFVELYSDSETLNPSEGESSVREGSLDSTAKDIDPNRPSISSSVGKRVLKWTGTRIHSAAEPAEHATKVAINAKFSVIATGTVGGTIHLCNVPINNPVPRQQTLHVPETQGRLRTGKVLSLEWTSDGYALAVGWEHGWAVISVGGRFLAWGVGVGDDIEAARFQDHFMYGVSDLFWIPGNLELFVLAADSADALDDQLFAIPFAKSAVTGQHSPDNTRYAFLQLDDRVLVYRGADQPDMSVINPESDVWQHIKIPLAYISMNWPIRYASISNDGRLIAVAGRRGLIHYSTASGRWKLFKDEGQEQAFMVRGGLIWFHHVLIAAVEVSRTFQVRLYSRDMELSNQNALHRELFPSAVVILSLVDNSLLVYTADNTLYHYLIVPTTDSIKLHLCGSISFQGVVEVPGSVRGMSWMIPSVQKQLGDPVDDLVVATILLLIGGKLVLLRPRKSGTQEVKYDLQILADQIEFCWIHLRGIGTLENSLWGYDGSGIRVWLDALTIESVAVDLHSDTYESVKESVNIPLDFYPLSVLMDKGIIIGVEHESVLRGSLPFAMFRIVTSTHLFIHHVLKLHLDGGQVKEAVRFASHYQNLVFFAHALEILLHTVVEDEAELYEAASENKRLEPGASDAVGTDISDMVAAEKLPGAVTLESPNGTITRAVIDGGVLPVAIEFLDHFEASLEVVVGCARKTEMSRWRRLFDIVGNPKMLFETCLASGRLVTAGSYLLVLHNLEQLDESNDDAVRLLKRAIDTQDWDLCKDLLRFLRSIDETGDALTSAMERVNLHVGGHLPQAISDPGTSGSGSSRLTVPA